MGGLTVFQLQDFKACMRDPCSYNCMYAIETTLLWKCIAWNLLFWGLIVKVTYMYILNYKDFSRFWSSQIRHCLHHAEIGYYCYWFLNTVQILRQWLCHIQQSLASCKFYKTKNNFVSYTCCKLVPCSKILPCKSALRWAPLIIQFSLFSR